MREYVPPAGCRGAVLEVARFKVRDGRRLSRGRVGDDCGWVVDFVAVEGICWHDRVADVDWDGFQDGVHEELDRGVRLRQVDAVFGIGLQ